MAHFFLGEHLTRRKVIGIIVSMAGMCLLMNVDSGGDLSLVVLTLVGAAAWAAAGIIVKIQDRRMKANDCNLIQYTTWQMVIGALALGLQAASWRTGRFSGRLWPWAVCSITRHGFGPGLFHVELSVDPNRSGQGGHRHPRRARRRVISGVLVLDEPLTMMTLIGMVMILAGIVCIVRQGNPAGARADKI